MRMAGARKEVVEVEEKEIREPLGGTELKRNTEKDLGLSN